MTIGEFGYPTDEIGKVGYYDNVGNCLFVITCKKSNREIYFLYETQHDGTLKRIDKGRDPHALSVKHRIDAIMRGETASWTHTQEQADATGTTRGTRKTAAKAKHVRSHRTI